MAQILDFSSVAPSSEELRVYSTIVIIYSVLHNSPFLP